MGVEAKSSGRLPMAASRLLAVPVPGSSRVPATASSREVSTLPVTSALRTGAAGNGTDLRGCCRCRIVVGPVRTGIAGPPAASAASRRRTTAPASTLSEARDQPCLLARAGLTALCSSMSALRAGGREEVALDHGQRGAGARPPVQRAGQPDATVELAVRPAQAVPRIRRRAQVVQDPTAVDVVLQPSAQARPGSGEGLVGDLRTPSSLVTSRAETSISISRSRAASVPTSRRGTRVRTGSPSGPGRAGAARGRAAPRACRARPGRRDARPTAPPRRGSRRWPGSRRR